MMTDFNIQQGPKIIRPFQLATTQFITHPSGMRVELIESMGSDIDIINAARVSYGKESAYLYDEQGTPYLDKRDLGVLRYMMREKHGSPFEMVQLKFRVTAPIKVIWEWVRHRIASYNIKSTRYVEWDKDYYFPQAPEWRRQVGKVGHYTTEQITDGSELHLSVAYEKAMESAFTYYGMLIGMGLHKEVAANVLPMGAMTEMIWSINVRSLLNFLALRTDEHALQEMQLCANMVEALTELIVPNTLALWREYNKQVP